MGELQVSPPANESFKEARGFHHLPLAFFDLAFFYVDHDVAVALDPSDMFYMDVDILHLATSEYPKKMRN